MNKRVGTSDQSGDGCGVKPAQHHVLVVSREYVNSVNRLYRGYIGLYALIPC